MKICRPLRVRCNLAIFAMATSVDFDHQSKLMTRKVSEKSSDRGLAMKVRLLHRGHHSFRSASVILRRSAFACLTVGARAAQTVLDAEGSALRPLNTEDMRAVGRDPRGVGGLRLACLGHGLHAKHRGEQQVAVEQVIGQVRIAVLR